MALARSFAFLRTALLTIGLLAICLASSSTLARADNREDLNALNELILQHPQDIELNLRYAHAAERAGKLRLALAAYERILINNPDNVEAQHGYEHVRRILQPPNTSLRLEIGEQWDSNPWDASSDPQAGYDTFARATWVDEREFGARRWRSVVNFYGELYPNDRDLNYMYAGASVGPMFDLTPNAAAIPAVGVAISSFSNELYYKEINAGVTVEGHKDSATYWARLRAGWRDYAASSTSDQGAYVELMGGVSQPHITSDNDWVVAVPWLRWSDIQGSAVDVLNDPIAPGQYVEGGVEATYNYRFNDHLFAAVGAEVRDRYYTKTEVAGDHRHDTYVAPKASLTFWNPVNCECGVSLNYRYRDNQSNDPSSEYEGHSAWLSISRTF